MKRVLMGFMTERNLREKQDGARNKIPPRITLSELRLPAKFHT